MFLMECILTAWCAHGTAQGLSRKKVFNYMQTNKSFNHSKTLQSQTVKSQNAPGLWTKTALLHQECVSLPCRQIEK